MDDELVWSTVLASTFLASLVLVGRKSPWGWALGIADEVLWIVYAVATRQWPFIVSAVIYLVVCWRNLVRWRRDTPRNRRSTRVAGAHAAVPGGQLS